MREAFISSETLIRRQAGEEIVNTVCERKDRRSCWLEELLVRRICW
jgi:hypothetical protein